MPNKQNISYRVSIKFECMTALVKLMNVIASWVAFTIPLGTSF